MGVIAERLLGVAQNFGDLLRVSRDVSCIRAEADVGAFVRLQIVGKTALGLTVLDQGSADSGQTQFFMCGPGFCRLTAKFFVFALNVGGPRGRKLFEQGL